MGIVLKRKQFKSLNKYSNKKLRIGFYKSLVFFGEHKSICGVSMYPHILGQRNHFYIINAEHHIEMLKRAAKFLYKLSQSNNKILCVNDQTNLHFDGIIKSFSYRTSGIHIIGHWPGGILTKNINLKIAGLLIFDPKKSCFAIKESIKLGLPILGLHNINSNIFETMYPIVCNNLQGDSLFFNTMILNQCILEGKLYYYFKKQNNFNRL